LVAKKNIPLSVVYEISILMEMSLISFSRLNGKKILALDADCNTPNRMTPASDFFRSPGWLFMTFASLVLRRRPAVAARTWSSPLMTSFQPVDNSISRERFRFRCKYREANNFTSKASGRWYRRRRGHLRNFCVLLGVWAAASES
jgi:hypothetical protein